MFLSKPIPVVRNSNPMLSDSSIRRGAAENYFTTLSQSEGGSQWTHEQGALSVVWTTSVRDTVLLS